MTLGRVHGSEERSKKKSMRKINNVTIREISSKYYI